MKEQTNATGGLDVIRLCIALLAALGMGCASDKDSTVGTETDVGESEPLYLIQSRIFPPEGTIGLLTPTHSLDAELDYSRSLEQPGGGVLYAQPGVGTFLIGSGEEPTITRYEVGPGDTLVPGSKLSFAGQGVLYMYAGDSLMFVDAHKAYYLDLDQLQLIAFDPTEMVITNTTPLAAAAREGFTTSFGQVVKREDGIYFPAQWYSEPDWDRIPSGSALVRLQPETDSVTVTHDPRCTGMYMAMTTDAGDTYWFSDSYNTFARRGYGPDRGAPECALRLKAGETTFDPNWQLDLGARVGGAPVVPILRAGGSRIWVRVLDESAASLPTPADYNTVNTAPAWQWYLLDVESDAPAVRNDERPLSPVGGFGLYIDGRSFVSTENADYSESTLLELTPEGFITRATVRGVVDNVVRVR
jgi:hypothetical protein